MNESLTAWRTREGTALLAFYGAVIAIVCAALGFSGSGAEVLAGAPLWVRLIPLAIPALLVVTVLAVRALRAQAYWLQAINIASFLLAITAEVAGKTATTGSTLALALCMFVVQYAFVRWQELAAVYGSAIALYAVLCADAGVLMQSGTLRTLGILTAVGVVCFALGLLRLRTAYAAATERFALERQTAELRRQMERNARMAFTDSLTGLLNRAGMNDLIERALPLAKENGLRTALLYIDLDGFKEVNDAYGHDAGDLALLEVSLRMQFLLRTGEASARIGGDEFMVLLPSVSSIDEPRKLARRIEEALNEPLQIGRSVLHLGASIGVAISGTHGHSRGELMSAADKAMYEVKRRRKHNDLLRATGARGA
ncbi:MAG TPA: diguanylate cyclase [Candidatus Baltobacteraceae bacterium]|nr:diguanylate cyclase [Candidatus Baltobacteraceae bacterium]